MTAYDPADTLSGTLPSLPPWRSAPLSVLDPRFPIRLSEPARIFWEQVEEWPDRETVITQTIRATQQHTVSEERFVRAIAETQPVPVTPPPAVYHDLSEAELQRDWDTGPGAVIPAAAPRSHRRRGPDGRFTRETS